MVCAAAGCAWEAHLVNGSRKHGSVGGVQFSATDDNQRKPKGQAECAIQQLLSSGILLLYLQGRRTVSHGACREAMDD